MVERTGAKGLAFVLALGACSSTNFGGSPGQSPSPPAEAKAVAATPAAQPSGPAPAAKPQPAPATNAGSAGTPAPAADANSAGMAPPAPAPPTGPGSDLTLVITDRDSKLDSFQVRNTVTQAWIPLTWQAGTQTVPGACSPHSKTILSLQMTAKGSLFNAAGPLVVGSCSAPLTQKDPMTVDVGVDPGCGILRASFELSCSGSSSLQVGP